MKSFKKMLLFVLFGIACFVMGAFIGDEKFLITGDDIVHAEKIIGISFTQTETDSMIPSLAEQLKILTTCERLICLTVCRLHLTLIRCRQVK